MLKEEEEEVTVEQAAPEALGTEKRARVRLLARACGRRGLCERPTAGHAVFVFTCGLRRREAGWRNTRRRGQRALRTT